MHNPNVVSILFQDQRFSSFEFDDMLTSRIVGYIETILYMLLYSQILLTPVSPN